MKGTFDLKCGTVASLIAAALIGLAAPAQAQKPSEEQLSAIRASCRSDFLANCSGVPRGGKEALDCLRQHMSKLLPACGGAVSAIVPPSPTPAAAAAPPPPAPPASSPPLAPPAAAAPPMPSEQQMKAVRFTCRREFSRFCQGVVRGGAQEVECLRANERKLSPDCRTSLADLGDAMPSPAVAPPPPVAERPKPPLVMTAVIGRSCLRDLIGHCRGTGVGDGEKMACLEAHADELTVLCKTAMKITTPLH